MDDRERKTLIAHLVTVEMNVIFYVLLIIGHYVCKLLSFGQI